MATQGYKMDNARTSHDESAVFHTTSNGIKAYGVYDGDKFQVLQGSEVNLAKHTNLERYNNQRKELLAKGDILRQEDKYVLKVTLEFKTPSGSSDFIIGGPTNGWTEWKDKDGKTLDEVYRKWGGRKPMEKKIKHLEMIQANITRMAQNSFMIKGWSLTLVVAMFAFVPKTVSLFVPIVIVPILIFALLDAYYLQLERRYRKLYDIVRNRQDAEIDFQLKITKECQDRSNCLLNCIFSKSIILFYVPILCVTVGIIIGLFI